MKDRKASGPEIESELAFVQDFMHGLELRRRLLRGELGRDVIPSNYSSSSFSDLSPVESDLNRKKWLHFMTVQAEDEIFDDLWTVYVQRLSLSPTEAIGRFMPHALTMDHIAVLMRLERNLLIDCSIQRIPGLASPRR